MDIHKPKPWHGFREFLKEYLIIVVGVLTALGAEAIVQRVHEARLSSEAKAAVLDEMNVNFSSYAGRFADEPCVKRRLEEIASLLDAAEAGKPIEPAARIGSPHEVAIYNSRWQAATAGGRTALLASQEQRQLGRVYQHLERVQVLQDEEYETWITFRALVGLRRLSPGMIDQQRLAVARARALDASIRQAFDSGRVYAQRLGVKGDARVAPPPNAPRGTPTICQPLADAAPEG